MIDAVKTVLARLIYRPLRTAVFALVLRGEKRVRVGPFEVVQIGSSALEEEGLEKLAAAAALLKKADPPRHRQICELIHLIVVLEHSAPLEAEYHGQARRMITVRASALEQLDVHSVAALLVHEATHGRLDRMGVSYGHKDSPRVERLCLRNEIWFLEKVPEASVLAGVKRDRLSINE